jgi:hypothetical protein
VGDDATWKTLVRLAKTNRRAFDLYIERLTKDTKTAENNNEFYKVMSDMYKAFLEDGEGEFDPSTFSLALQQSEAKPASTAAIVARTFAKISASDQAAVLAVVKSLAYEGSAVIPALNKAVAVVNKVGGNVVLVTLSAIYVGWEAIKSLKQWWKGEISGKRCAKQVIDGTATFAAGVGGGFGGAAVGSILGPIGAIGGAIIGGWIASSGAEMVIDWLTQKLFDLPKEVATEKAYNYLGKNPSSSNSEINTAFRQLCLKHHPDKGGDVAKFLELQSSMGMIKLHRGEM